MSQKYKLQIYPTTVMSELTVVADNVNEAIKTAEHIALTGKCKFYKPDRKLVVLVVKEPPLAKVARPDRKEGELLEGGQDDGS